MLLAAALCTLQKYDRIEIIASGCNLVQMVHVAQIRSYLHYCFWLQHRAVIEHGPEICGLLTALDLRGRAAGLIHAWNVAPMGPIAKITKNTQVQKMK